MDEITGFGCFDDSQPEVVRIYGTFLYVCLMMCHFGGMDNSYFIFLWTWMCACAFYARFSRMCLYYERFISDLWRKASLFQKYFINLRKAVYERPPRWWLWRRERRRQWQQQQSNKVNPQNHPLYRFPHTSNCASLSYPLLSICLSAFWLDLWFCQSHRILLSLCLSAIRVESISKNIERTTLNS